MGSSYGPSELLSAVLLAQLEEADDATMRRRAAWTRYHTLLEDLELAGALRRPAIGPSVDHNAHIYYVLMPTSEQRRLAITRLGERGISATFHYSPLHLSAAGRRFGTVTGILARTENIAARLMRLPMYADIRPDAQEMVVSILNQP